MGKQIRIAELIVPKSWYQDSYFCVGVKVVYEYRREVTDNAIGTRYTVLLESLGGRECKIFVPTPFPPLFTLDELNDTGGKYIAFEELELKLWGDNRNRITGLRGDAKAVEVVG